MKNKVYKITLSLILLNAVLFSSFATSLKEYVCIVRIEEENLLENTVTTLKNYSKKLSSEGYSSYVDKINNYLKGSFGSGFIFYASNGRPYIITNRHVVSQAETANISFENEDGSISNFKKLKIVAVDENIDIALIALPENFKRKGLKISSTKVTDGMDVWSAGFPGFGTEPIWQFGKGTVTNSSAKIKELISPEISSVIQHSAQVDGGNSGGPLLIQDNSDSIGYRVIGINTWKATHRESTNFAIPAKFINSFSDKAVNKTLDKTNLEERVKTFLKDCNDSNTKYLAISKYISNEMVDNFGGDAFIRIVKSAPVNVRSLIITSFEYNPIEALRYSLAYEIWKKIQGPNGTVAVQTNIEKETSLGTKVIFTKEENEEFSFNWIQEQGLLRINEASIIKTAAEIEKTTKKNNKDPFFLLEDFYYLQIVGGISTKKDKDFSFIITDNFYAAGIYYQKEKTTYTDDDAYSNEKIDTEISSVGILGRIKLPLTFGKISFIPYGELRIGYTFLEDLDIQYGAGAGMDLAYQLSENIAPVVGAEYLYTSYDSFIKEADSVKRLRFYVGIKFLEASF